MLTKPKLYVREITLSVDAVAAALALTVAEVGELFGDARLTGRLAEVWGTRLYGYRRHTSSNHPGSDGVIQLGPIGRYSISVRSFKASLRFQQSKFMGSGRTCSKEDLISSLEGTEVFVAVDLRRFPCVVFYPLDTKWLLRLVREGKLSPAGLSARRFDELIAASFELVLETRCSNTMTWIR